MRVPARRRAEAGERCLPLSRPDPSCAKRRIHHQEEEEGPALKLHLSEDAVCARLQRLSLENEHNYGGNGFPNMSSPQPLPPLEDSSADSSPEDEEEAVLVDPGEFCMDNVKVLRVCPLLQEAPPLAILPDSIIQSLSSPCLELVIWSPPSSQIQLLLRSLSRPDTEEGMDL